MVCNKANAYHCILKPRCWGHSGGKLAGSWPSRVRASLRKVSQRQPKQQLPGDRAITRARLELTLEIHKVHFNRRSLYAAVDLWIHLQENALWPHQEKSSLQTHPGEDRNSPNSQTKAVRYQKRDDSFKSDAADSQKTTAPEQDKALPFCPDCRHQRLLFPIVNGKRFVLLYILQGTSPQNREWC